MTRLSRIVLPIVFLLFYLALVNVHSQVGLGEFDMTDDLYFNQWTHQQSYPSWVSQQYLTNDGRLTAESAVYLIFNNNLWLWRLINPLLFCLLAYTLARYAAGPVGGNTLIMASVLAFTFLGLMAGTILTESALSITGSLFYLWPAALGFYALLPMWLRIVHGADAHPDVRHWLAGILAALAQEQVALLILGCSLVFSLLVWRSEKRVPAGYWVQTGLLAVSVLILFAAPGNAIRYGWSVDLYYPGFDTFSPWTKTLLGLNYLFTSLVNLHEAMLIGFAALAGGLLLRQPERRPLNAALSVYLAMGILFLLASFDPERAINLKRWLFNFDHLMIYPTQNGTAALASGSDLLHSFISMVFWGGLYMGVVPLALGTLFANDRQTRWALLVLYLGGLATLAVMFFSPTIYASGGRTRFLFELVWIILTLFLALQASIQFRQRQTWLALLFLPGPLALLLSYTLVANDFALSTPASAGPFHLNPDLQCEIDLLDPKSPMSEIQGWVLVPGEDPALLQKYLVLRSGNRELVFSTNRYLRPQITARRNDGHNYDQSGFYAYLNLLDIAPGSYQIGIGVQNLALGKQDFCPIQQTITVQ